MDRGVLDDLYEDLERREIRFRPHAWLSTDWFVPDDVPGIAIPFYLAHPRLMKLERKQMLDVEGGTRQEMMQDPAARVRPRARQRVRAGSEPRRRELFGDPSKRYPEHYRPNPASRRLRAASAALLRAEPSRSKTSRRRSRYPRLARRRLAQALRGLAGAAEARVRRRAARGAARRDAARIATARKPDSLPTLGMTLREYYADKRERYLASYPDIYDRDLRRLFSDDPSIAGRSWRRASCAATARRSAAGLELDRRVSVHARAGPEGHDRPQPRAEAARGRTGAPPEDGVRDPADRQDDGFSLQPRNWFAL